MFNFLKKILGSTSSRPAPQVSSQNHQDKLFKAAVADLEKEFHANTFGISVLLSEQAIEATEQGQLWVARAHVLDYVKDNQLQNRNAVLVWPVTAEEVDKRRHQTLVRLSMYRLVVRQHQDQDNCFLVVNVAEREVQDPILRPVLDDYQSPIFYTSLLGQFKLNKLTNFFESDSKIGNLDLKLYFQNTDQNRPLAQTSELARAYLMTMADRNEAIKVAVKKEFNLTLNDPVLKSLKVLNNAWRVAEYREANHHLQIEFDQADQLVSVKPI